MKEFAVPPAETVSVNSLTVGHGKIYLCSSERKGRKKIRNIPLTV